MQATLWWSEKTLLQQGHLSKPALETTFTERQKQKTTTTLDLVKVKEVIIVRSDFVSFCTSVSITNMGNKRTWDCVKSTLCVQRWAYTVVPPLPVAMLWPKKALIFTHFAPNSTLLGVGGEGSLVLVISLERSQHFWPSLSEKSREQSTE